jgi:hypothetical protein
MLELSVNKPYACQFCKSTFMQERTLAVHMCEQKRRYLAKDEKHVFIGYQTYNKFYRITQQLGVDKTYDDFAHSPYYNAMVKFGSFVNNTKPLYPDKFIDYVVRSGVKLDHWCRDELYEKYVINLIHTESVETALERSVAHMQSWATDNNAAWNHYFKYVSTNRAVFDVKDGKVSPWLILNSASGKAMIKKFTDDQLSAVTAIMDIPFWLNKFKRLPADTELVRQVVKESNI